MEGSGGVVAILRGLPGAGINVTLLRGSDLQRELGYKQSNQHSPVQSSLTQCNLHESQYLPRNRQNNLQECPIPSEIILEKSFLKADRSCSPLKTTPESNLYNDVRYPSATAYQARRQPYRRGSMFTTPSQQMDLFTSSLRRYPSPASSPTSSANGSSEFVERILTYTQDKNSNRISNYKKDKVTKKRNISDITKSRDFKTYRLNEAPTKERSEPRNIFMNNSKPLEKLKVSADDNTNEYDYFQAATRAVNTEVRYLNEFTDYIKKLGKSRCNCNVSAASCPKMQNRYNNHVKEHHQNENDQGQVRCTPPDTICEKCAPVKPCDCNDDEYDKTIDATVDLWHQEIPVYSNECPLDAKCREKKIKELKEKLKALKNDPDRIEKSIKEIRDCIKNLPFWLPSSAEDEARFKTAVADNLILNLGLLDADDELKENDVKEIIAKWMETVPVETNVDKQDLVDSIYDNLLPALSKEDNNKEVLTKVIADIIKDLPLDFGKINSINDLAVDLASQLLNAYEKQKKGKTGKGKQQCGKASEDIDEDDSQIIRKVILHGVKNIPEFFSVSISEINKVKDQVDKLAKDVDKISKENKGDVKQVIENKVEEWLDEALKNVKKPLNEKRKKKIGEKIKEEILSMPSITGNQNQKPVDQNQIYDTIEKWQKDIAHIDDHNNTANAQNLSTTLQEIVDEKGLNDYTKEKMAAEVTKWLDSTVKNDDSLNEFDKTTIAKNLVDKVAKTIKPKTKTGIMKKSMMTDQISDWYTTLPLAAKNEPEENEEIIKKISKRVNELKSNENDDNIKDEVLKILQKTAKNKLINIKPEELDAHAQNLTDTLSSIPSEKTQTTSNQRKQWIDKDKTKSLRNKINEVIDSSSIPINETKRENIVNRLLNLVSEDKSIEPNQITQILEKEYSIDKRKAQSIATEILDKSKQVSQNRKSMTPPIQSKTLRIEDSKYEDPQSQNKSRRYSSVKEDKSAKISAPSENGSPRVRTGISTGSDDEKSSSGSKDLFQTQVGKEGRKQMPVAQRRRPTNDFVTSTPKKGPHRAQKAKPDEFDTFTSALQPHDFTQEPSEIKYRKRISDIIGSYIHELPLNLDPSESQKIREAIVNDLAENIVDRNQYLQINPSAKVSSDEEVKHLKYQMFRWLNKLLDEHDLTDAMKRTESVIKHLNSIQVPEIARSKPLSGQPSYNQTGYGQRSDRSDFRPTPYNTPSYKQPSPPFQSQSPYDQSYVSQNGPRPQSDYIQPDYTQAYIDPSMYGGPNAQQPEGPLPYNHPNMPNATYGNAPYTSRPDYSQPSGKKSGFDPSTDIRRNAHPNFDFPETTSYGNTYYGPTPGSTYNQDDFGRPSFAQPRLNQSDYHPDFTQSDVRRRDYEPGMRRPDLSDTNVQKTWAPVQNTTEFIEENIEGAVTDWFASQPFYKKQTEQNKRKLKQMAPEIAKEIKNSIGSDDTIPLDERVVSLITKKLGRTSIDLGKQSKNEVAKELFNQLRDLNLFEDLSVREEPPTRKRKLSGELIELKDDRRARTRNLSKTKQGSLDDTEIRDESDDDAELDTTVHSHLHIGISDWLKDLPAYQTSDATSKRRQERALSNLILGIRDIFHDVYTSDNEKIPSKIFDQEMEKHLNDVLKSNISLNDDIVKETIKNLKHHIVTLQSGEKQDPNEYLKIIVDEWSDSLPVDKNLTKSGHDDRKEQFFSQIKKIRQNIDMPKDIFDQSLKEAATSYLKNLPIEKSKINDDKFVQENVKKLMGRLNVIPLGLKKGKKKVDESVLGFNERETAEYIKEYVDKWCDDIPFKNETQKDKENAKKLKQYLAKKLKTKIAELNSDPQVMGDQDLYLTLLRESCEDIASILPKTPELVNYMPVHIDQFLNTIKEARDISPEELSGKIYKQQVLEAIHSTLPSKENLTLGQQASFEVLKDELTDAFINLHCIDDDEEHKESVRKMIRNEIDKFAKSYLEQHPNEPLDTEQLKKHLQTVLNNLVPLATTSLKSESEEIKIKYVIKEWVDELPLQEMKGTDWSVKNKMISVLAKGIQEKEKQEAQNLNLDLTKEKRTLITDWLKRMPLKTTDAQEYEKMAMHLINKLKNKRDVVPPSSLTKEDWTQMEKIRDRVKSRSTELDPDIIVQEHSWGTESSIREGSGVERAGPGSFIRDGSRIGGPGRSGGMGSYGQQGGFDQQGSMFQGTQRTLSPHTVSQGTDTCKCQPCCQKKKDTGMSTEYQSAYGNEGQNQDTRCYCKPQGHRRSDDRQRQYSSREPSPQRSVCSRHKSGICSPYTSSMNCPARKTLVSTRLEDLIRPCPGRAPCERPPCKSREESDEDDNVVENWSPDPCFARYICPRSQEVHRPCPPPRCDSRNNVRRCPLEPIVHKESLHRCKKCYGKCPHPSHLYFRR